MVEEASAIFHHTIEIGNNIDKPRILKIIKQLMHLNRVLLKLFAAKYILNKLLLLLPLRDFSTLKLHFNFLHYVSFSQKINFIYKVRAKHDFC